MILTSQGHLSTAGGQEGYLSIASTSGGHPSNGAEMALVYLNCVPNPRHGKMIKKDTPWRPLQDTGHARDAHPPRTQGAPPRTPGAPPQTPGGGPQDTGGNPRTQGLPQYTEGTRRLQTHDAMLPKQTEHNITTTHELDLYPWEGHMWHYLILLC